ncbi:MAG: DNA polymerase III subunit delta [Oscillospiraceae bacterium]|nr:DNA polymerase III subunit delta [Oscillospiraceae bacterium]
MANQENSQQALQALKAAIRQRQPQRLYFFHGEETFLLNYYLQQLKKILVEELTESFNFHKLNAENFDLRSLADAVESLPMMAEHTFVWVDEIDIFKLNEDDRNKLVDLFSDIPEYCTVVFTYETTPWKQDKRYKKLYEAVITNGVEVEFAKQSQRELVNWISRHFAAEGKSIAPELCVYLIELTGGTMTVLSGEISKICAYSGADHVVKSDIDAVVEPVLDAIAFQMTNFMADGAYGKAMQKLQQLLQMQQKPLAILGAVGWQFRRLSTARVYYDSGKSAAEYAKLYRNVSYYNAENTISTAKRFSARFYARSAELIMETERKMKTSTDDAARLLEVLVAELAAEARND